MPLVMVHYCGPPARVGETLRQRCVWCGALLAEYDLNDSVAPEDRPVFSPFCPIAVLDDGTLDHLAHPPMSPFGIPSLAGGIPGACAGLPHDVTR